MKNILLFYFICILFSSLSAQCPNSVTTVASVGNPKCFELTWTTPPSSLPSSISFNNVAYSLITPVTNPPSYSNTNCNGVTGIFSGVMTVNGEVCNYNNGILPVKYKSIDVYLKNGKLNVAFQVESEIDNAKYILETSENGSDWLVASTLNINLSRNHNKLYAFAPTATKTKAIYVRIKQEDLNGKSTYSKVFTASESDRTKVSIVTPSLVSDNDLLVNIGDLPLGAKVNIYNLSGRLLFQQSLNAEISYLNLAELNRGQHLLINIVSGDIIESHRIFLQ